MTAVLMSGLVEKVEMETKRAKRGKKRKKENFPGFLCFPPFCPFCFHSHFLERIAIAYTGRPTGLVPLAVLIRTVISGCPA
jgi:hypothetical protein